MFDLEKDLPTTPDDVEALRCAGARAGVLTTAEYFLFLANLGDPPSETLRARPGPRGDEPFEL